jgi:hypothetical protein
MKFIHYWRFSGQWYAEINDDPKHIRIPSGDECDYYAYAWKQERLIENSIGMTHRQIKKKLTTKYPDHILVKEIAYHEGARWHGYKVGSRLYKHSPEWQLNRER